MTMTILADEPAVAALWRYPVKSMQGEELNASQVTSGGLLGDRQFAVVDPATGKVAGAKNPRKWPGFLQFRAAYVTPPLAGAALPAVRVTLPDGSSLTSDEGDLPKLLSEALGRDVVFSGTAAFYGGSGGAGGSGGSGGAAHAEDYVIDADDVIDFELPAGTFFDCAPVHLVTTATLDSLRLLYPAGRFEPRRFRPNVIVATGPSVSGFPENDWVGRVVAIGDSVRLRVLMATGRCVMTTLPQSDLPKDSGILRTAAQHNDAAVGVYAEVVSGGLVRRGDVVTVL
jgi:MOSC domain-containing protein